MKAYVSKPEILFPLLEMDDSLEFMNCFHVLVDYNTLSRIAFTSSFSRVAWVHPHVLWQAGVSAATNFDFWNFREIVGIFLGMHETGYKHNLGVLSRHQPGGSRNRVIRILMACNAQEKISHEWYAPFQKTIQQILVCPRSWIK